MTIAIKKTLFLNQTKSLLRNKEIVIDVFHNRRREAVSVTGV